MLFLAASIGVAMIASVPQQAANAAVNPVWSKIQPNILRINEFGQVSGLAVLLDEKGNFLVHRSAFVTQPVIGFINDTEPIILTLVTVDEQTQLALLHAENWLAGNRKGVRVSLKTEIGSSLVAATKVGPVRGELVSDQKVGQMRPSLRYAPLSEIRLESNVGKVGGALVFDEQGGLVGLLGATLTNVDSTNNFGARADVKSAGNTELTKKIEQFGPQGLTVAYSLGPTVLKRVVDGFLSRDHKVKHPNVGLFFKDSKEPGAVVELVTKGSPAEQAGLAIGDLIIEANGQPVNGPVDLAVQLFQRNVGDTLTLKFRRNGVEKTVNVKVEAQVLSD